MSGEAVSIFTEGCRHGLFGGASERSALAHFRHHLHGTAGQSFPDGKDTGKATSVYLQGLGSNWCSVSCELAWFTAVAHDRLVLL